MKLVKFLMLIGAIVFFSMMARGGEVEDLCTKISKDSDSNTITLTVFDVAWMIETPTNISPETIRKWHTYQYVSNLGGTTNSSVARFLQVVGGDTLPKQDIKSLDCRWLFIVTDAKGQEKLTIYTDNFFSIAIVNGNWFKPNRQFKRWVNHMFGNAFELEDIIKED